jgi:hypothetical protein
MSDYDRRSYYATVRAIAAEIAELPEDDQYDRLHEEVDGSAWIIYTYAQRQLLRHTDNEDAVEDVYGSDWLSMCETWDKAHTARAYFAMYQDIADALHRMERASAC